MKRLALGAALLIGTAFPGYAAIDPDVATSDLSAVVNQCALVAAAVEDDGSNPHEGECLKSTGSFLTGLSALDATPGALDQYVTDLVLALAPLAQGDEVCNAFDDEIARAIELASGYASEAQRLQLVRIGQTIGSCSDDDTGALPPRTVPSRNT